MNKQKPLYLTVTLAILTLLTLLLSAWTTGQPAKRTERSVVQSLMGRLPSLQKTDLTLQVSSTEPTTETVPLDNAEMGQLMEEPTGMMDSSMPMTSIMPMTGSMMMESMGGDAEMRQMMQMMGMMMSCMAMMESDMGAMDSSMPMTGSMMMKSMGGDAEMRQMMQMMGMMMSCMEMMESGMGVIDSTMPMTATTPLESPDGAEDLEDSR